MMIAHAPQPLRDETEASQGNTREEASGRELCLHRNERSRRPYAVPRRAPLRNTLLCTACRTLPNVWWQTTL
jgi:hypothetical protein